MGAPKKPLTVTCPRCKKKVAWDQARYKPFCSKRCWIIDLGNWADQKYKIGVEEEEPGDPDKD